MSGRAGKITASLDLFVADPARREEPGAPVKLRLIVWSGVDFTTATMDRGAIFEDPADARAARDKLAAALEVLGIEVNGATPEAPLLPDRSGVEHEPYWVFAAGAV